MYLCLEINYIEIMQIVYRFIQKLHGYYIELHENYIDFIQIYIKNYIKKFYRAKFMLYITGILLVWYLNSALQFLKNLKLAEFVLKRMHNVLEISDQILDLDSIQIFLSNFTRWIYSNFIIYRIKIQKFSNSFHFKYQESN